MQLPGAAAEALSPPLLFGTPNTQAKLLTSCTTYLLEKKGHQLILNTKRDSSHSFGMTTMLSFRTKGEISCARNH
ncbi:hypothetical protein AUK22_02380 [bacterium CG2_30_54_10]|nr:MAG: hypothetical protein AUK22_02380 [bacterium CG2_30_54_10]